MQHKTEGYRDVWVSPQCRYEGAAAAGPTGVEECVAKVANWLRATVQEREMHVPLARESDSSHHPCRVHQLIFLFAQIFLILEVLWPAILFLIIVVLRLQFPPEERPDGRREKAV